jgi:hypothetical protein
VRVEPDHGSDPKVRNASIGDHLVDSRSADSDERNQFRRGQKPGHAVNGRCDIPFGILHPDHWHRVFLFLPRVFSAAAVRLSIEHGESPSASACVDGIRSVLPLALWDMPIKAFRAVAGIEIRLPILRALTSLAPMMLSIVRRQSPRVFVASDSLGCDAFNLTFQNSSPRLDEPATLRGIQLPRGQHP